MNQHVLKQSELDDLVRDLNRSKQAAEENNIVFCSDTKNLLIKMSMKQYEPSDYSLLKRLLIDSSKRSLKCILLDNGNEYAKVATAHSTKLKEKYCNITLVLNKIKYNHGKWQIFVDLNMVNIVLGQQGGYIKFPCFIRL